MKIKGITVRLPPLLLAATVFFAVMCAMTFGSTRDLIYIYIGLPLCALLIGFPLWVAYTNEKQVLRDALQYRSQAKFVRARQLSPAMRGSVVLMEGKVLKVTGLMMNKPSYLIQDPTGQVVVKRFALPDPLIGVGADVEILGRVFGKAVNAQSLYINALTIKPVQTFRQTSEETQSDPEKIRIKKLN
ncbi:hypothetical protein SDC9_32451 [bioreactor metagenome]|uniref:Nucleotide-binding protein n=1 Tax=bioreactor metagenome TaxID=1076179 RepID=A0A644V5K2_9ZZZZ|nr:hypothetical protein [Methanocorpusculum sp.]